MISAVLTQCYGNFISNVLGDERGHLVLSLSLSYFYSPLLNNPLAPEPTNELFGLKLVLKESLLTCLGFVLRFYSECHEYLTDKQCSPVMIGALFYNIFTTLKWSYGLNGRTPLDPFTPTEELQLLYLMVHHWRSFSRPISIFSSFFFFFFFFFFSFPFFSLCIVHLFLLIFIS